MGDFWQNLNKGIDQIVPFALKKQDLENERARLAAQMQRIDQQNALVGEQVNEMRRKREMREGLTATLQELIGKGVPGKETVSVQDLIPGDTGDVDRGFSTTGIAPLRTEEREVRRQPTAEELLSAVAPYAEPEKILPSLLAIGREDARDRRARVAEDSRFKIAQLLEEGRDRRNADRIAAMMARVNGGGAKGIGGNDDKIIDDKRLADWIATVTGGGKEPGDADVQLIRKAARKLGYDFKKTPGTKYHRELFGITIPGTEGEEGGKWSLVDAMGSGGADATPPPGFVDSGRTSGGKKVYVKGDQAWVAP